MKWTREERDAITATMEHWKDDVIPHLIKDNKNEEHMSDKEIESYLKMLHAENLLGTHVCHLCIQAGNCKECSYYKVYGERCYSHAQPYSVFVEEPTILNAIKVYNKVADMIHEEHYEKED